MNDVRTRLAELRAAKEQREAMRAESAITREAEVLELESRFEGDLGERGAAFEIVTSADGPIVLKLPEAVLTTRFLESKVTAADVHDFVMPCVVHPSKDDYRAIIAKRPLVANRCATALLSLAGAKKESDAGKY